jgi:hypothetical protein
VQEKGEEEMFFSLSFIAWVAILPIDKGKRLLFAMIQTKYLSPSKNVGKIQQQSSLRNCQATR